MDAVGVGCLVWCVREGMQSTWRVLIVSGSVMLLVGLCGGCGVSVGLWTRDEGCWVFYIRLGVLMLACWWGLGTIAVGVMGTMFRLRC